MWMVNGDVNLGADNRKLKSDTWQLNRDLNIGTDDHQLKPDTWRMNEYVNLASDDRKVKPDMWRVNGGVNLGAEDRKSKPDTWRVNGESKRSGNKKQPLLDHPKGAAEQKQNTVNNSNTSQQATNSVDKRFKSLPPAEALPRSEILGGYIFVCNNDTMQEDLKRQLFGLPQRYRDSVRAIQPGLPLFLYNYTTHQLHGIYEATSFGGSNIDPTAWEDKKSCGESRFPAQVRIRVRKLCKALEEDAFRPVLHHYDGPKFRLQLSVPETIQLLDLFTEKGATS
ncbi:hypothetical protein O6H91_16G041700 [Diphasiastrum complanatum]|uniref:Uncharacterized protein n=1 Tax=Diphasiastrum complanatum TaxID=34168 RepID=A0ACC2BCR9_DIPCM|nr:hypothetical protein O6H91_16G041700 [Diphasiastrum complanatum]